MAPARRTEFDKSENRIARYRRCELSSPFCRLDESIIVVVTAAPPVRSATRHHILSQRTRLLERLPLSLGQSGFAVGNGSLPGADSSGNRKGTLGHSNRLAEKSTAEIVHLPAHACERISGG